MNEIWQRPPIGQQDCPICRAYLLSRLAVGRALGIHHVIDVTSERADKPVIVEAIRASAG